MGVIWRAQAADTGIEEYRVKAAFLFNFAKFVQWPPQAFKSADGPIELCLLGPNPFGSSLDQTVQGKTAGNRALVVREIRDAQQASGCHILFVSAVNWVQSRVVLGEIKQCCALTVGESADFIASGGMINLRLENARVRVEINPDAAERAKLRISSKLLSLAEIRRR
jgi:hypothetical protein